MTLPREIDQAVVTRLSALPEHAVLDFFWLMDRGGADRHALLLMLSAVVIARPSDWDRACIRREHEQRGSLVRLRLDTTQCFACRARGRRLYFHHILEVQHGGSNATRNQVPLCFSCHQFLHPWLTEDPGGTSSVKGFERLRDVMRRYAPRKTETA